MQFTDLKTQYAALKPRIDARIQRVLDHGQYIMGPEVAELEAALAARLGVPHAITVASGTEALLISLMALGVGPGDEVITSPFTFVATAEVIVLVGARPVFVDVEPDTGNLDARQVEAALTPRTRAVMPVSLYGQMADLPALNALAAERGIAVIEDAAQSFGATLDDGAGSRLPSGGASTVGCTSFFPSKPLGGYGDGGAIFTADGDLATACREIRVHGQSRRYHHTRIGLGGRMDTLQCAIVLAKLERFDAEFEARETAARRYDEALAPWAAEAGLGLPARREGRRSAWAQYTVQLPTGRRAAVQAALLAEGIPTAVHYPTPLHHQPAYAALCCADCCPVSTDLAARVLSLPMSADVAAADQARVVDALRHALTTAAPVTATRPGS
jgi:UDP-2-acetamido-2-deoxy-ribo-hexuluronate aminotransferase